MFSRKENYSTRMGGELEENQNKKVFIFSGNYQELARAKKEIQNDYIKSGNFSEAEKARLLRDWSKFGSSDR